MEIIDIKVQYLAVQLLTFLIGIALLWKPGFKYLATVLEQRREQIRTDLDRAQQTRLDSEQLKAEYQKKLAAIEQEAREKIQQATREAQAARNEMLDEARHKKDELLAQTASEIEREKRKALVELRDQIALLAVDAAEQVVRQKLDPATQRVLIDNVVRKVGA